VGAVYSPANRSNYYFYLVVYNVGREPVHVHVIHASEPYEGAMLEPQNSLVSVPEVNGYCDALQVPCEPTSATGSTAGVLN